MARGPRRRQGGAGVRFRTSGDRFRTPCRGAQMAPCNADGSFNVKMHGELSSVLGLNDRERRSPMVGSKCLSTRLPRLGLDAAPHESRGAFTLIEILIVISIISLLAMPLSLLAAIITLSALGYTINTMSLGGMAIAIGSLVDDAIIDVENIYRRLRKNVVLPPEEREPPLRVVYMASTEVRSSIWNATLIIIITFLPLFLLGDLEGRMLRPLGISFIVSLFASLIVAVTVTPVLSSYLLTGESRLLKAVNGSWTERNLGRIYRKTLDFTLGKSRMIIGFTALIFLVSVILLTTTGSSFLPAFNEGALTVNISLPPGVSLEESEKMGVEAQKILLGIPEVTSVACKTGRAELAEHFFGENTSELDVPFELSERSRDEFFADVREKLRAIPGASI